MVSTFVQPAEFVAFVLKRGHKAEAIFAIETGKIMGYTLRGPRNNKKVVSMNENGMLPIFDAQLWCDGIDYTNRMINRTKSKA